MSPEELELVRDDRLVCRAVIDVEVVDARVRVQFTVRSPPGSADGRTLSIGENSRWRGR